MEEEGTLPHPRVREPKPEALQRAGEETPTRHSPLPPDLPCVVPAPRADPFLLGSDHTALSRDLQLSRYSPHVSELWDRIIFLQDFDLFLNTLMHRFPV